MSPIVEVDFDEVPDEAVAVGAGLYMAEIKEIPVLQAPKEDPERGQMAVTVHVITTKSDGSETEHKGRVMTDYHCLWMDLGKISFKRLCLAGGLTPGKEGVDLVDLIGKPHQIQVSERTYKDDAGVEQKGSNIKDYIIPE